MSIKSFLTHVVMISGWMRVFSKAFLQGRKELCYRAADSLFTCVAFSLYLQFKHYTILYSTWLTLKHGHKRVFTVTNQNILHQPIISTDSTNNKAALWGHIGSLLGCVLAFLILWVIWHHPLLSVLWPNVTLLCVDSGGDQEKSIFKNLKIIV